MNKRRGNKVSLHSAIGIFLFVLFCLGAAEFAQADLADHLVINEIQSDSISGAGGSADDFIELYNPSDQPVSLDGWSIQKQSSASTSVIYKKTLSGIVEAGSYYLIVRGDSATDQALIDQADILTASNFSVASNNVVYLVDNDEDIESQYDSNIIDYVGWGSSEMFEVEAAPNPSESKSISRVPNGEDSDNNSVDFVILDQPTPMNSSGVEPAEGDSGLAGEVLISIYPDAEPVQDMGVDTADIVFSVNSAGFARINYGLTDAYGEQSALVAIEANASVKIVLENLVCGTSYHYRVYAENNDASDSYQTEDASFATLPCGIEINSLTMSRSQARANDEYIDGWAWDFEITVWDMAETNLKMKFASWSGAEALDAGDNMQYSIDSINWIDIVANDTYPDQALDIGGMDTDLASAGRQVSIQVRMKVPFGTLAGSYGSEYGILTEVP